MTLKNVGLGIGMSVLAIVLAFVLLFSAAISANAQALYGTGDSGPVTQNAADDTGTMDSAATGTTPGLPNTGAGGDAAMTWAAILAVVGVALAGTAFFYNNKKNA
jgi:LPXTG-motif cell wall-anchored protein